MQLPTIILKVLCVVSSAPTSQQMFLLWCCCAEAADAEHGVQRGAAEFLLCPVDSIQHTAQLPETAAQVHTHTQMNLVLSVTRVQSCQKMALYVRPYKLWHFSTVNVKNPGDVVVVDDAENLPRGSVETCCCRFF